MNTSHFTKTDDEFLVFDLTARFAFKTTSSVSFELGRLAIIHPDDEPGFEMTAFQLVGWIDVHYPCDSPVKMQMRICVPVEYHGQERMVAMVHAICAVLSMPSDCLYEARIFTSEHVTGILPKAQLGMG